jgi:hypothetical protein
MDEFLEKIKALEKSDMVFSEYLPTSDPLVSEIASMADELLIDSEGHCNWDNMKIMERNKYDVFPIERDRFGWLIGGIQTSKGIIAYG